MSYVIKRTDSAIHVKFTLFDGDDVTLEVTFTPDCPITWGKVPTPLARDASDEALVAYAKHCLNIIELKARSDRERKIRELGL